MIIPRALVAFALLLFSIFSGAQTQDEIEKEALNHCDRDQLSMNLCSHHEYKVADAELNDLYRQQMSRLRPEEAARFKTAQRAWLKYVEADCLYQNGPREESGTIWPMEQNGCLTGHTSQRASLIKEFLACTSNGCPGE